MKLEELQLTWERDSNIDRTELGEESLRIPMLHAKYFKMYSQERLMFKKMEGELKKLYRAKYEWYSGIMSEEDLKEHGWEPNALRILRADIPMYMESDEELNALNLRIEMQREKMDFLESIIKSLTNRGFQIKAAIEWEKFKMGI